MENEHPTFNHEQRRLNGQAKRHELERVLDVCRTSASLSEAGRTLFAVSRQSKKQPNDADRLRKYLARFGLDWDGVRRALDRA
ncbi:hypothetical protein WT63_17505 [Burkholderia anthina]|nr:hypothetical protein WT63_17505 [Burkholderia anthina]